MRYFLYSVMPYEKIVKSAFAAAQFFVKSFARPSKKKFYRDY